jgi:TRAP transporter TAXI family solute receptor
MMIKRYPAAVLSMLVSILVASVILWFSISPSYAASAGDKVSWRVICGEEGGLAYGMSGGLSKFISERVNNLQMLPEPGGTVAGARLVSRGEATATYGNPGLLQEAYAGKGPFEKTPLGKVKPLHTIYFYPVTMFMVVRADSNIHKIDDLAGKKISLGTPAVGLTTASVDLFKAWGLWDKVDNRWISMSDFAEALKAERVDAVLGWTVGDFSAGTTVVQIDLYSKVRVLSLSDAQKKAVPKVVGLSYRTTPAKSGFKQNIGVDAIPGWAFWYGFHWASDADPELVYKTVKAFFDGRKELLKISRAFEVFAADPKDAALSAISSAPEVPVHPGAARYYKEIGIWQKNWVEGSAAR